MISKKILKYTQKITLNTTIWQKYQKLLTANEFKFLTYNFQSLLASNSKTHQHYIQLLNNKRWMEYKNHKIQNKLCCSLVLLLLQQGVGGGRRNYKNNSNELLHLISYCNFASYLRGESLFIYIAQFEHRLTSTKR